MSRRRSLRPDVAIAGSVSSTSSIRFHDAMPRCSMLVTQPNAIIGQLSIVRYALNATNWPSVMRPRITSRLPSQSTSSAPSPRKNDMLGKKNPCSTIEPPVAARGTPRFDAPEALDLGGLLPVRAHHADAGQRLLRDRADLGQLRLNLLEPLVDRAAEVLHRNRHERQRDEREQRQPRVDATASAPSATTNVSTVFAEYITAGPIIIRTAFRSLVARDIRSPVRCVWKYESGSFSQMREEVVAHVVLDVARRADEDPPHQEPEDAADDADRQQQRAVQRELGAVTPVVRSSIA